MDNENNLPGSNLNTNSANQISTSNLGAGYFSGGVCPTCHTCPTCGRKDSNYYYTNYPGNYQTWTSGGTQI